MAAEFKILVGADLDAAVKSINDFVKTTKNGFGNIDAAVLGSINEFKKLQSLLNKSEDPKAIAIYQKQLQSLAATLSTQIPPAAAKTAASLNNVNKAVANANPTLVNFGRVVQDAPFGIIGIANNIDPLISSFQSLKASTGSTGGALKSLFAGLAGPAGIAIAVSAVTSALVAFGPQIKEFITGFGSASKITKEAREEITKLAEEAAKELVTFGKLAGFIADASRPLNERKMAIAELRKQYGPYLKNLTDEEILIGRTKAAYDAAIESILRKATIKGLEKEIEKEVALAAEKILTIQKESLLNEQKKNQELKKGEANTKNAAMAQADAYVEAAKSGRVVGEVTAEVVKNQQLANQALENAPDKAITRIKNQLMESVQPLLKLTESYKDLGIKGGGGLKIIEDSTKDINEATKQSSVLLDAELPKREANLTVQRATTQEIENANAALRERNRLQALSPLGAGLARDTFATFDPTALQSNVSSQKDAKDEEARLLRIGQTAEFAAGQITDLFNQSFTAISQGESPIKAITNSLKGLIVRLAAAAAAAALLSALLPGGTAIGGVVAGGGQGFGALFGSLFGLASGGIASRPTPALIGDGGPEAVIPLSQLANIIGGVAMQMGGGGGGNLSIVRGQDIYYSNNNASRSFGRLFG
jgi:hypothetical protein